ncbi:MAG: OmpA family protein [Rhodospirillales bacterium]
MGSFSRYIPITSAFLLSFSPTVSLADDGTMAGAGFYIDLGTGALLLGDSDLDGGGIDTDVDFETGYAFRSAVGHAYDSGWRAEVEVGYRENGVDSIGSSSGTGDAKALSGMINGYYDFRNDSALTPYVGLGLGLAQVEADGYSPVSGSTIDDDDLVYAYQGILGASWSLTDALALTADYRYLATDDVSLTTASGTNVDGEYRSHAVFLGLRISFGGDPDASRMATGQGSGDGVMQAADETAAEEEATSAAGAQSEPAPAAEETMSEEPAAAEPQVAAADPAPDAMPDLARQYRVLFAFDSAALSGAASASLREIAGQFIEGEIIRIDATGHADAAGTQAYNMALSKHRAEAVKATLVDFGIPADNIVIDWKGETELLVPTADGVREPQNRRVEIVFPQ